MKMRNDVEKRYVEREFSFLHSSLFAVEPDGVFLTKLQSERGRKFKIKKRFWLITKNVEKSQQ